jgi:hypothetical protein
VLRKVYPDRRSVTTSEVFQTRVSRSILDECMWIARQEVNVPVESHTEAGRGLILGASSMREKDLQGCTPGKLSKQWCLVLNRVRGYDDDTHAVYAARLVQT